MTLSYGEDYEYAGTRLVDSWVRYKDDLVRVRHIRNDSGECTIQNFLGEDFLVNLEELDITPIPLGYVNYKSISSYIARMPTRHYRQGIRPQNIKGGQGVLAEITKEIVQTMLGIFPSIDQCIESIVNEESKSKAFCRQFSLCLDEKEKIVAHYKDREVGIVDYKKALINLKPDFLYLSDVLGDYQ
tara:strand:- start:1690 stop:2247 length:558 start_codon:yes stop_codon:yes gene_type:complete